MSFKIQSYHTCKPIEGVCKQSALWVQNGGKIAPLIYLQRPKWIESDEIWESIVGSINLNLPKDFEVK